MLFRFAKKVRDKLLEFRKEIETLAGGLGIKGFDAIGIEMLVQAYLEAVEAIPAEELTKEQIEVYNRVLTVTGLDKEPEQEPEEGEEEKLPVPVYVEEPTHTIITEMSESGLTVVFPSFEIASSSVTPTQNEEDMVDEKTEKSRKYSRTDAFCDALNAMGHRGNILDLNDMSSSLYMKKTHEENSVSKILVSRSQKAQMIYTRIGITVLHRFGVVTMTGNSFRPTEVPPEDSGRGLESIPIRNEG